MAEIHGNEFEVNSIRIFSVVDCTDCFDYPTMWVASGEPNSLTDKIEIHWKLIATTKLKFILKGSFLSFHDFILYAKSLDAKSSGTGSATDVFFRWSRATIRHPNPTERRKWQKREKKNYSKIQIHWNCGRFMYTNSNVLAHVIYFECSITANHIW